MQPDDELVAALRARDEATFVHLVERWTPVMTRVARAHVATDATAADVVQDTWVAVLHGLDRFERRSSLRTWVFRILTNTAKTRGARDRVAVPWSSLDAGDGPTVDPARFRGPDDPYPGGWRAFPLPWPDPAEAAVAAEVHAAVVAAIETLPVRHRTVIELRDVLGFTSEEVCDLLGVSAGNQRVLLHRARSAVRAHVEERLGPAPLAAS